MNATPVTDDKTWYNRFYGERRGGDLVVPREIVERYRRLPQPKLFDLERWHQLIGDVRGRKVLYLACGVETSGVLLALLGGKVWVVDLAFEAILQQRKMGIANGTSDRTHFVVGSCGRLPLCSQSFDLVIGIGIWHHLQEDLETPCSELARILKQDGFAVFEEPIIRSNLMARLRKRIPIPPPGSASPQCRPLAADALEHFTQQFHLEAHSFRFIARFDRLVLGDMLLEFASAAWRRWTVFALHFIDFLLLRIPGFDRFAGVVILKLTKRTHAEATTPTISNETPSVDRGSH
jgi:SAM-dependent methyltransferase